MTIPVQSPRSGPYLGDNGTVAFAYNFLIDEDTELVVVVKDVSDVETIKTITVDYTVSGVGSASGGDVEFVVAPASGEVVGLYRATELAQGLDLQNRAVVTPQLLEDAYDELTKITQDIDERSTRSLKVAITDIGTFTGDAVLPPAAPLATITWNAAGDGFENGPTSEEVENAEANAAAALASKQAAAISETNAAASETAAGVSEAGAEAAKADAEAAATASNISAVAAAASESAAAASELATAADVVQSGLNASGASTSESNAGASAAAALASENAADASESAAAISETNAGISETNAAASAVTAATFDPALYILSAGDTMTGDLTLSGAGVKITTTSEGINTPAATDLLIKRNSVLAATVEAAGTASALATTVITREKGDDRYYSLGLYPQPGTTGDFNDVVDGGFYTLTGSWTNGPSGAGSFSYAATMQVWERAFTGGPRYTQIVSINGTTPTLFVRVASGAGPTWGAWAAIGGGGGLFKGDNGEVGDSPGDIFRINNKILTVSTTVDADENASATGPLEVDTGVTLTVTSGGTLAII